MTVALLIVRLRRLHRWVAPFVMLPLLTSVITGTAYRVLRDWFGMSRDEAHWLMSVHEGEWLGPQLEPVVVVLNGVGVLWLIVTGGSMVLQSWRTSWKQRSKRGKPAG